MGCILPSDVGPSQDDVPSLKVARDNLSIEVLSNSSFNHDFSNNRLVSDLLGEVKFLPNFSLFVFFVQWVQSLPCQLASFDRDDNFGPVCQAEGCFTCGRVWHGLICS